MSFFARMAAKSEIRVRDLLIARVHNAANRLGESVKCGQVELVCPFVAEQHNGFFVSGPSAAFGMLRCKGYWWLFPAPDDSREALESGEAFVGLSLSCLKEPVNLGPVTQNSDALAAGLVKGAVGKG